jgi:ketosteroid isomerase-like protein
MKKIIFVISIILFSKVTFASTVSDDEQLHKIVKDFENAITTIDRSKYFGLFYEGTVSWVGVSSTNDFKKSQSQAAAARKKGQESWEPMKTYPGDHIHFFDVVVSGMKDHKMVFENIKIQQDGDVASAYLDYSLLVKGSKANWGKKSLLLVKAESGWKINSVIFSISSGE